MKKISINNKVTTAIIATVLVVAGLVSTPRVQTAMEMVVVNTFYVSNFGNDSNNGSLESPWKTIQRAANLAKAGDTVMIAAGTYRETVQPKQPFVTYNAIGGVLIIGQSYPGCININVDNVIIDGITCDGNGLVMGIKINNADNTIIKNSDISNAGVGINIYGGSSSSPQHGVTTYNTQILNNHVHHTLIFNDTGEGIYMKNYQSWNELISFVNGTIIEGNTVDHVYEAFQNTSATISESGGLSDGGISPTNTVIRNNIAHDNLCEQGITSMGGDGMVVTGNKFYNNNGTGSRCSVGGGGKNITITNNLIVNNSGVSSADSAINLKEATGLVAYNTIYDANNYGIAIYYTSSAPEGTLTVANNIFYQVPRNQIYRSGGSASKVVVDHNWFGKTESNIGTNVTIGNPMFVSTDPNSPDFLRLQSNSPACTAGQNGGHVGAIPCGAVVPTNTGNPTNTPSVTVAPATATPSPTRTATATRTATQTSTFTSTATKTPTFTATNTATNTVTLTPEPTNTPEPTPTPTEEPTPNACVEGFADVDLDVEILTNPDTATLRLRNSPVNGDTKGFVFSGKVFHIVEIWTDCVDWSAGIGDDTWFALKQNGLYYSDWRE